MSNWITQRARLNSACLNHFSETITFTSLASGESTTLVGIVDEGVQPEEMAPGVYAMVSCIESAFASLPEGEITIGPRVYKILRDRTVLMQGMYTFLLRFDREVFT